jgi:hypothetical protein
MRHVVLCGVLFAMAASASEYSWSEFDAPQTFVGLAVIPLTQGALALDGERVLSPKVSARLGVRLDAGLFSRDGDEEWGDSSLLAVGIEPGFRYYLTGSVTDGLWVGPHLELSGRWRGFPPSRKLGLGAGIAALVGYSMVVSRGLTLQAGVGLGASYSSGVIWLWDGYSELASHDDIWGLTERASLSVGWVF